MNLRVIGIDKHLNYVGYLESKCTYDCKDIPLLVHVKGNTWKAESVCAVNGFQHQ